MTNSILAFMGVSIAPIIIKVLKSKDFRDLIVRLVKTFMHGFAGKILNSHYLFKNEEYYIAMSKDVLFEDCPRKTKLFRMLLETKINSVNDMSKKWLKDNEKTFKKMDKLTLRGEMFKLIQSIVKDYECGIPENYFKYLENREKADKAFDIIYNGTEEHIGFKDFHSPNVSSILKYVTNIPIYITSKNTKVVDDVLGLMDGSLLTSIQDLKERFETINGDLKKI